LLIEFSDFCNVFWQKENEMERERNAIRHWLFLLVVLAASATALGCGKSTVSIPPSEILSDKEPDGAIDVLAFRADAKDGQDVVVVGRIGGRENPWIKGTAAFPIVDRSLKPCNEIPGDTCETPWDYCCEANLSDATALVTIVDKNGQTLKQDPREFLKLKELQTVVAKGKVKRDNAGNVTVLASQLHVRPDGAANK
jgi:hypothetical protein